MNFLIKTSRFMLLPIALLAISAAACTRTAPVAPTLSVNNLPTAPLLATPTSVSQPTVIPPTETPLPPTTTPTITPTPSPVPCENKAEFVTDVTIADGTEILPKTTFTKTWRLRNTGTCEWGVNYSIVFQSGTQMGVPQETKLAGPVAPGSTADLSVEMTSPELAGNYRADFLLRDDQGKIFGTGASGDRPFYVEIKVASSADLLDPGSPTWTDNLNNSNNWVLLNTPETKFTVAGGFLTMTSYNPGSIDWWGLSTKGSFGDIYLEMTARTGPTCSGLDRYGFIFRAADPTQGYVVSFACNGRYRLYKWDGSAFTGLKNWTTSSAIQSGPDKVNQLGIWMEGDQLKVFANRKLLTVITDSGYSNGRFGLMVASGETSNFTVAVDQVSYWEIE